jgi:adenylate cyclase
VSLLLLLIVPMAHRSLPLFGLGVATIAILYGLATSWMMGKLVALPVRALREALQRVGEGDLHARVHLLRADDFGHLIEGFNRMADGLREREQLQQTFGRHVGRQVAREIMAQGDGLGGRELEITAMFVDIRNFTAHSASHTPAEVVSALNVFFSEAVDIVESHGGLVNKFLGDGLMALFGIGSNRDLHADRAVTAARALLCCLRESREELTRTGWPELAIGIGVNSGPAVVGSVGSPRRQEYTAIGDTVNVASRVEALTKQLERPLLITAATRERLALQYPLQAAPPQRVRGKEEPIELYAVAAPEPGEALAEFSLTASWSPG